MSRRQQQEVEEGEGYGCLKGGESHEPLHGVQLHEVSAGRDSATGATHPVTNTQPTLGQLAEQAASQFYSSDELRPLANFILEALETATEAQRELIDAMKSEREATVQQLHQTQLEAREALEAQREQLEQAQKDLAEAKHLSDLACRARDAYSDERDAAYRERAGWRDLAADYKQQLAQVTLERDALRTALREARYPLEVAASYRDDPDTTVGLRLHARDCAKALEAMDAALNQSTGSTK